MSAARLHLADARFLEYLAERGPLRAPADADFRRLRANGLLRRTREGWVVTDDGQRLAARALEIVRGDA